MIRSDEYSGGWSFQKFLGEHESADLTTSNHLSIMATCANFLMIATGYQIFRAVVHPSLFPESQFIMRDDLTAFVKRVRDLHEHVRGNEQATKQSLIGPLLTLLGYDLTDPRECIPEFRADFGPARSNKPVDWAFLSAGKLIFFVEAKEAGRKLAGFDEQLADYFAKAQDVKLGILTNGVQWRFFTDAIHPNIMDREPFASWDVLADDTPPYDVLTVLQKSQFNPELIRTYAQRKHRTSLLVSEISRLLEPAPDFVKLAISSLETRNLTSAVVDSWKPIVAAAVQEWARQHTLDLVLSRPQNEDESEGESSRIETTEEELEAFARIVELLGTDRPVEYEDTRAYFKVHLPGQSFWAVCRLIFNRRRKAIVLPLPVEQCCALCSELTVKPGVQNGWSAINLETISDLDRVAEGLRAAWDQQKSVRGKAVQTVE